jgi:hypothetical protein
MFGFKSQRGSRRQTSVYRPRVEALEERCVPTVSYHGGPLLANVGIESVFYGNVWSTNPALFQMTGKLDTFLGSITNSTYLDQLREYSEPGYQIGRGQFLDGIIATDSLFPGTTVTDDQIQQMLDGQITGGTVRTPDANRLYFVFTPPGVHVEQGGEDSFRTEPGFLGYHNSFTDSLGQTVNYAVIVDQVGNYSIGRQFTPFQQFTEVSSHELAEAITDPTNGTGWWDSDPNSFTNGDEIGDIVNQSIGKLNGYTVQHEWSNLRFDLTGNGNFLLNKDNVHTFLMDGTGTVYELTVAGNLLERDASGTWNVLDTGVRSILLGPDFSVGTGSAFYELKNNGNLWAFDGNWNRLDSGVRAIALGPDLSTGDPAVALDVLYGNGDLWQYDGAWNQIDRGVKAFAASNAAGNVFALEANGNLQRFNGTETTIDTGVKAFILGSDGSTVDALETHGNLWQFSDAGQNLLDQGVVSIGLGHGGQTLVDVLTTGQLHHFAV